MNSYPLKTLHKVTALVTRETEKGRELLLFRHPTAGIQLPAGTVELNELPEIAVLRELQEETGIKDATLLSKIGEMLQPIPPQLYYILRTTKLFDEPTHDANTTGFTLFRGAAIRHLQDCQTFAQVAFEEYDLGQTPPTLVFYQEGYVRRSLLTRSVLRHFYHLTLTHDTPTEWDQWADGHLFHCYWSPLQPIPQLVWSQQDWLTFAYPSLIS